MANLGFEAWMAIGGIIFTGVTSMLYTLSATLRDYQRAQELKENVESLKQEYSERLAALRLRAEMDAANRKAA